MLSHVALRLTVTIQNDRVANCSGGILQTDPTGVSSAGPALLGKSRRPLPRGGLPGAGGPAPLPGPALKSRGRFGEKTAVRRFLGKAVMRSVSGD